MIMYVIWAILSLSAHVLGFSSLSSLTHGEVRMQSISKWHLGVASPDMSSEILRKVDKWACIKDCGACCKLGPLDSRPDLPEYLTEAEFTQYVSMIGEDDFCKHYDQKEKMCTIYEERPSFCVVKPEKMKVMFDVEEEDLNNFCAFCCREQISDHYGEESNVMKRFEQVIASLRDDEDSDYEDEES